MTAYGWGCSLTGSLIGQTEMADSDAGELDAAHVAERDLIGVGDRRAERDRRRRVNLRRSK